jgi:hypothetical protein
MRTAIYARYSSDHAASGSVRKLTGLAFLHLSQVSARNVTITAARG